MRAERNAVASAMKGKLDASRREELIEQGTVCLDWSLLLPEIRAFCAVSKD